MHTYKITYNRDSLEKILNFYSHEGYVWETDPKNMLQGEQKIFLRHDIDVSLEVAREMAKTEEKYAVNSVFFIMVNSPFYNIFEYNQI